MYNGLDPHALVHRTGVVGLLRDIQGRTDYDPCGAIGSHHQTLDTDVGHGVNSP